MTAEIDPAWRHYPQTILRFECRPVFEVDLRVPLSPEMTQRLRALGSDFAIVTAADPYGEIQSAEANDMADGRLLAFVKELGYTCSRVIGSSPDGAHREPGYAIVGISREMARDVAAEFAQTAFFWFADDAFLLVPTSDVAGLFSLPPDAGPRRPLIF